MANKGTTATICYTQEYSFSYWSFTYPVASCGNRRGRYRQRNIPNHANLTLPAYSSYWTKGILEELPLPRKQVALILKARAYRDAISGPRRSILISSPKYDHSPQPCVSQRGYNIEFSCAAESLGPDSFMEQSSSFRTECEASAATTCYTQEYSFSYWSFTYPAASCGNRRGR